MNREIEFRLWDESHKRMLYPDDKDKRSGRVIDSNTNDLAYSHGVMVTLCDTIGMTLHGTLYTTHAAGCSLLGDYPKMQFTGLKDNNGKKIYEGDIVKDTYEENHPYSCCPDNSYAQSNVFVVEFKAPTFVFPKYSSEQTCIENFKREVMGNIFENPELI